MAVGTARQASAAGMQRPTWMDDKTLNAVRPEVREILQSSEAFAKLPEEEQRSIAQNMVKIASYMANPDGLAEQAFTPGGNSIVARANAAQAKQQPLARQQAQQEDPTTAAARRAGSNQGFAGEDFKAGGVNAAVEGFGALVKKVDFPKFVSGLIKGVFQAIVESSIQQMRAYGELVSNVSKAVDQFARDNISENNARDWMQDKYPDVFNVDVNNSSTGFDVEGQSVQTAQLTVTADDAEAALTRVSKDLGLPEPITDISDPESEQALVQAARLEMARGRQQLLASMVMLGINRIVVTDGLIHAKVVFDVHGSDTASRRSRASLLDRNQVKTATQSNIEYGGWFSPVEGSFSAQTETDHMTTVQSSLDENSESKADVKAKLTGEVRVNFKSDYLPMERMATPEMIAAIQGNAQPRNPPNQQGASTTPAAPAG
ncbi:MAG: hypothetical protein KF716_32375 [Anaerolineae bacterium]|nr:hypothetical protein [Anaerolineae bacterium]